MKYEKVPCDCGRLIGANNFRRHLRRCYKALKVMAAKGVNVSLLDERPEAERLRRPLPTTSWP